MVLLLDFIFILGNIFENIILFLLVFIFWIVFFMFLENVVDNVLLYDFVIIFFWVLFFNNYFMNLLVVFDFLCFGGLLIIRMLLLLL